MKRLLLLLGAVALFVAAPVSAQYMYIDTNGDGVCNLSDVLGPSTTSIDIYVDTSHNADGSGVTCDSGTYTEVDMTSYTILLRVSGSGTVAFGTFTNNMANFTTPLITPGGAGADYWAGYGGTTFYPASGNPYKVATIAVSVTNNPVINFATSSTGNTNAFTSFGSECLTSAFDATWVWGTTFMDACGTSPTTDIHPTTWGEIKELYK